MPQEPLPQGTRLGLSFCGRLWAILWLLLARYLSHLAGARNVYALFRRVCRLSISKSLDHVYLAKGFLNLIGSGVEQRNSPRRFEQPDETTFADGAGI